MLTFISGWRTPDRDRIIINHRNPKRSAVYFIDDTSTLPYLMPETPIIELWRNGRSDFDLKDRYTSIVRVNFDTDQELIYRAVGRALMNGIDSQIVVTFDALERLQPFIPALREVNALLANDTRVNAAEGDHVIFMKGGSFVWKDHLTETKVAALIGDETLDLGVIDEALIALDI